MDDGQRGLDPRVGQVGVIGEKLRRQEHPLVADRAARHRGDVEGLARRPQQLRHAALGALAGQEEPPLQFLALQAVAGDEHLADHGLGVAGQLAQAAVVRRHVPPAQHPQLFLRHRRGQYLFALPPHRRILGKEQHGHPIPAESWKGEAEAIGLGGEELVRHLEEDAGPVAGRFVGPRRPAVHEVQQHLLAMLDDGMIA